MTNFRLLTGIIMSLLVSTLSAQSYEDILRYSQPTYSGTARSMSMGDAMGSLGGDFSAIGINPAGIAAYRSSEFSFTPSLIINSTKSNFDGVSTNESKTKFSLNQVGFVGTYRPMRDVQKGIVSTHFAIGYNRNNNFNYKSMATGRNIGTSMTDMFTSEAYGYTPDEVGGWGGLTGLGYNAYLIDYDDSQGIYTAYTAATNKFDQTKIIEKDGYSGDINVSTGMNISNILLLGVSANYTTMRYKETSNYFEEFSRDNNIQDPYVFNRFTVNNRLDAAGYGFNIKVGAIIKPTKHLRVGIAYHSPTWFKIEEDYGTRIDALFFNPINEEIGKETFAKNYDSALNKFDYKINTPDKIIASASYVFGKKAIISFDYEYMDYANAKFKTNTNNYDDIIAINEQNELINKIFTSTNNYRAGLEFRVNSNLSLRGGYSLQVSPLGDKEVDIPTMHGVHQLSDFKDNYTIQGISGGFGYRNKNYFVDVAYRLSSYDTSYFNYDWPSDVNIDLDEPLKTEVTSNDHFASITVGWKF
ncbi:OmpP1/FadL family transporter [Labilibacter marinus]|uniref:OmpP1/FadL family transporter n=1 Tax=Labilibacter marinus TaxID=1477105 RepID=UPI00082FB3FC|nr:outer membrane protein transport protein [Labilibacter marinus]